LKRRSTLRSPVFASRRADNPRGCRRFRCSERPGARIRRRRRHDVDDVEQREGLGDPAADVSAAIRRVSAVPRTTKAQRAASASVAERENDALGLGRGRRGSNRTARHEMRAM